MIVVQGVRAQEYFSSASDFARLYVGVVEPQYQKSLWHDIPYYNGTMNMYKGRICYHGVVYENVQLRFDQLKQCVVVLPPGESVVCLPDQDFVDWFEMDGYRYVHDPEDSLQFASQLSDGSANGLRLYHRVWKVYSGEKNFGGKKYLKTLSTEEQYTLMTPDGEMHHVKRASDVAKLFPEQKKQIKQFARKNHLSFSKRKREQSLVKVVESLNRSERLEVRSERSEVRSERIDSVTDSREGSNLSPLTPHLSPLSIDEKSLITGIPVLDSDTIALSDAKVYIVPGVKKARASIADDQELAEIVVVGGRQSTVDNMMIGAEKFKPQILKNIPSALVSRIS